MGGTERKYVADAFDTDWIVPLGPHVDEFERRLAAYLAQDKQLLALSAGTAAIHLALVCLGVGKDDEVVCQSLTFSASANPIAYQGARPVFVDSEPDTMNISPAALADALDSRRKATGAYPKAIVAVDLYGMPAKWDEIEAIASERGVPIVEDAAEALGSRYKGRCCGTFGAFGALSFNGNKIITTSGGGALICPDEDSRRKALFFATQARENLPYYYHKHIGFNYRLSNICGAIGCGQMEVLPERVARRQAINAIYAAELSSCAAYGCRAIPEANTSPISGLPLCSSTTKQHPNAYAPPLPPVISKHGLYGAPCTCSRYLPTPHTMAATMPNGSTATACACQAAQYLTTNR